MGFSGTASDYRFELFPVSAPVPCQAARCSRVQITGAGSSLSSPQASFLKILLIPKQSLSSEEKLDLTGSCRILRTRSDKHARNGSRIKACDNCLQIKGGSQGCQYDRPAEPGRASLPTCEAHTSSWFWYLRTERSPQGRDDRAGRRAETRWKRCLASRPAGLWKSPH